MASDNVGILSTTSLSAGYWKSVTASSVQAGAPATKAGGSPGDKVSMSKLGEALNGRAAEAFQHLDAKARGMLDGLVNSGVIKAEEVVRGLEALADAAVKRHTMESAPGGAASVAGMSQGEKDALSTMSSLDEAFRKGQVSQDEYGKQLRENTKALDAARQGAGSEDAGDALGGINDRLQQFAKERLKARSAMAPEDRAALDKLSDLGFDATVYKDGFARYAADADKPAEGGAEAPAQAAPASQATNQPAAPQAASASAAAPAANADPSNSAAALSLLQSALNAGTKGATGLFGNAAGNGASASGGMADSLLQSLKAGAGKPKTDDAQGV